MHDVRDDAPNVQAHAFGDFQRRELESHFWTGQVNNPGQILTGIYQVNRSIFIRGQQPESLGNWNSVFKRFSRWCKHDVWKSLHTGCSQWPDLQRVLIDSTITRAHACAAGAAGSSAEAEALGRSRGGFTTKIHAVTDALGNPLDFILTAGQASDIGQAENLLALTPEGAGALLGDKGYDSDAFIQALVEKGIDPIIPPRSNRNNLRSYDWFVYKERHLIECFFSKIKHYRRVFSRYEKKARIYMGFIHFVSALIWLR